MAIAFFCHASSHLSLVDLNVLLVSCGRCVQMALEAECVLARYVWERPHAESALGQERQAWLFSPQLVVMMDGTMEESGHPDLPLSATKWHFSIQSSDHFHFDHPPKFAVPYLRPAARLTGDITIACRFRILKRPVDLRAVMANPQTAEAAGHTKWEQMKIVTSSEKWVEFTPLRTSEERKTLVNDKLADAATGTMSFLIEMVIPKSLASPRRNANQLADDFLALFNSKRETDVSIVAADGTVGAHRVSASQLTTRLTSPRRV